jgi:Fe2+ transport system protein FeoA
MSTHWITLDQTRKGQRITIREIESADVRSQVVRFGIGVGEGAVCQEILPGGPIVLRKNRQEIAIGRPLARSIKVEVLSS